MHFPDIFRLDGRVAIVTGAAQGLGRAMAEGLLEAGATVAIYDLDPERGAQAACELGQLGPTRFVRGSVTDESHVEAAVEQVVDAYGGVDILVNNAGLKGPPGGHRPAQQMDLSAWQAVMDVNLTGVFLCCKAVYRPMVTRGGGCIINIASIYGLTSALNPNVPYNATKAGVMGLTRELAVEWAGVGIRVNAIAPGFFATESSHRSGHFAQPALRARIEGGTPLGRGGDPTELKGTAIYLTSEASSMVTGQTIVVDGGWLVRNSMPAPDAPQPDPALVDELAEIMALLAAQPSASYHEAGVARAAREWLAARRIPVEADAHGSLLARDGGRRGPPLVLVAHMDHPAVHLTPDGGATLVGGVAASALEGEVRVRARGSRGERRGVLRDFDAATRRFRYVGESPGRDAFAVWDLPDLERAPDRWTMRAADDLVGVCTILWLLARAKETGASRPVIGALTRAEEIGLIGATLLAESKRLPEDALVISLEASRTLPGAEIGQGPVVRVGDRTSTFSPAAEALLYTAAQELAKNELAFRFQRQLMSGGTCEATVFTIHGYQTGALAIPLGNYHNVDPDGRLAAEYVSPHDLANLARLLESLLRPVSDPQAPLRRRLTKGARAAARHLKATARDFG